MAKLPRGDKRVVVISDPHCGNRAGLTPPGWQLNPDNPRDAKWYAIQAAEYDWWRRKVTRLQPVHLLLIIGDLVDGKSKKAGGRDVIRQQRIDQVDMALTCIRLVKASHIEGVYGTRYHVRDWEDDIYGALGDNAKIGAHGWAEVNGVVFDFKHKVGASTIPHGRATSLLRADLQNALWAEAGRQPRADVILRGHVHYCVDAARMVGEREVRVMSCPALQGVGSEFGGEQCEGLVDFGFLHFDVHSDGSYSWQKHIAVLPEQKAQTSKY